MSNMTHEEVCRIVGVDPVETPEDSPIVVNYRETVNMMAAVVEKVATADLVAITIARAARKVVDARYYDGDDGWDRLKEAIGELEDLVGRFD